MNKLSDLRSTPLFFDDWMISQVGEENNGPYKGAYPNMPVEECKEPLVSVNDFGITGSDFYLGEYLSGKDYLKIAVENKLLHPVAYLRRSHVKRLQRVDKFLRESGLFIHIQSGWRHPLLQEAVIAEHARVSGQASARRMFAPVLEGAAPPPHATGAAFDLELRSLESGKRQEMYCRVDGKQIYGGHRLEILVHRRPRLLNNEAIVTALENRRILFHCLCTIGVVFDRTEELFTPHPGECWHFGDGDPLSAFLRREKVARYGLAYPDAWKQ